MSTNSNVSISHLDDLAWRKSSYSSALGNCVEVALLPSGQTAVRDSQQQAGPALVLTHTAWHRFCSTIKVGKFDPT